MLHLRKTGLSNRIARHSKAKVTSRIAYIRNTELTSRIAHQRKAQVTSHIARLRNRKVTSRIARQRKPHVSSHNDIARFRNTDSYKQYSTSKKHGRYKWFSTNDRPCNVYT